MSPTEETTRLQEIVRRDYLVASTTFVAVRAVDMTSTALGVSKLEEISAGLGFKVESNPILTRVMEELGVNQGAILYGVASAATLLGVAYVVNKIGKGRDIGNFILHLNSIFGMYAATQNLFIYSIIKDM